jgi:hypothetical protein
MSRKRIIAGAVAVTVAGAAAVFLVGSPAFAADTCNGKNATIVSYSPGPTFGTSGDDVVVIKGNGAWYDPIGGRDTICIQAPGGSTVKPNGSGHWIQGGPGPDTIDGSGSSDSVYGGGGNDTIRGNGGPDGLHGGDGDDYIRGNSGDDTIYGDYGNDCLIGGTGHEYMYGGPGDDRLSLGLSDRWSSTKCLPSTGAELQESLSMLDADGGFLDGDHGRNNGGDDDWGWGSNGRDLIYLRGGDDWGHGFGGDDHMDGEYGADIMNGDADGDYLLSKGPAHLYGGTGADSLAGSLATCYPENGPATGPCGIYP